MWPDWSGETVVIVAAGPSAKDVPLALAKGRCRFIAINESWRLCPWADALYACDRDWWRLHKGVPGFSGLKFSSSPRACDEFGLTLVSVAKGCDVMLNRKKGLVGDGGNSGFQALNLAIQFGAVRVLLVGYDMRLDAGRHWHGDHPKGLNNPRSHNIARWLGARWAVPAGVEVINCSAVSALEAFPKRSFMDVFQESLAA